MESVGIRELRQHASRYVAMAKAGQRVPVTERGKLVAYLVPADDTGTLLESLAASGDYAPPAGAIDDLLPPPSIPQGRRPLSEVVTELRDAERW
ncbi:MAG: type II toxin-antitoxin system prevent-host-death family antitoxin [Actinomycetota bacterium]|nr:type II toxin-antitoxin system prevent-host-death family antitoxin [Actinomycetota bacterium]